MTVLAWHGEASLKAATMNRLRESRRLDAIVQGRYFDKSGRGCQLGCLTRSSRDTHAIAERWFGIEQRIGYWLEGVFEGLPKKDCAWWVIESTNAIPVSADMSKCHHHFGYWLLGESGLLTITDVNREAIERVRLLHGEALRRKVTSAEWSAAWSAARSAWSAESAAWSAAWSAERSAESAALSAWSAALSAWSAESAALSAWSAESAVWSAAWKKMAEKSIEIFAAAPVRESHSMPADVAKELRCRNLWCPDGELVAIPQR